MSSTASKPRALDLFSGCGGLSLGLRQAGFQVVGAVEIDDLSAESYELNHPSARIWREDITEVDPRRVRSELGLRRFDLDLIAACPPCQGFSRIRTNNRGRRVRDHRNRLMFEVTKFAEALRPKAILVENVPGLTHYYRFREFCRSLEDLGYDVSYRCLDAADFGVAQRRLRLVLTASRVGELKPARRSRTGVSVRDAIGHLPKPGRSGDPLHDVREARSKKVASMIRRIPRDGGSRKDLGSRSQLDCHRETDGFYDVYGRMAWDAPAPTLTAEFVNPSKGRFLHPTQHRAITLREAALLQSFPSTYRISLRRGKFPAAGLIGNAFPPEFARRQAKPILNKLAHA